MGTISKTSEAIDALFAALIEEYGPNVVEALISGAMKEQVAPTEITPKVEEKSKEVEPVEH